MSAIVTSHSSNNQKVFEITEKNHSDYCLKHGYIYIPNEEPYSWYIDPTYAKTLLDEHEYVLFLGCDLIIQRSETLLETLARDGVTMCRELKSGVLNGDSILFKRCDRSYVVLDWMLNHQHEYQHTQAALNGLYAESPKLVQDCPHMQLAFPAMNPSIDYRKLNIDNYFALHFHTIGKSANVGEKTRYLTNYAKNHK